MKRFNIKPLVVSIFLIAGLFQANAYCNLIVSPDGSGDYTNIQEAINNAPEDQPFTITVTDGTYTGEGNINVDFLGRPIALVSQNGNANTIIDCQSKGRAFYFHTNETNAEFDGDGNHVGGSLVDGFTIINARTEYGGAIRCGEYKNDGEYMQPGETENTGSPTIRNCVIKNSYSNYVGAAIACNTSSPVIQGCTITNNRAAWYGGGISGRNRSFPVIESCTISNNSAYWGGGIYSYETNEGEMTISNCIIKNNTTKQDGGGVSLWKSTATISNCVVWGNSSYWGAGITGKNNSTLTISNCVIAMNYAGGFGGGVYSDYSTNISVDKCTISENFAYAGNNSYTNPSGYPAGGIYTNQNSWITVTKSILWDNSLKDVGLYKATKIETDNRNYANSSEISWSCITATRVMIEDDEASQEELDSRQQLLDLEQNNYSDQGDNISEHPGFEGDGKYSLPPNSPCRDVDGVIERGASEEVLGVADSENITPRPPAEEDEEFYECFISSAIHTR